MMSRTNRCVPCSLAVILALTVAGCGGGGGNPANPLTGVVDLKGSQDLPTGPIEIEAGESRKFGTTTLSCAAGGRDCTLTVVQDEETEALTATATGGRLTLVRKVDLAGSTDLNAGTTTIPAGESVTTGRTTLRCAAGGEACEFTVQVDPVTNQRTATQTGGTLTVTVTPPPRPVTPVTPPPPPPAPVALTLPAMHDLKKGTVILPAGQTHTAGGTVIACPTDGAACTVAISDGPGGLVGTTTGGTATVTLVPFPTWIGTRGTAVDTAINTPPGDNHTLTTDDSGKNSATKFDMDEVLVSAQGELSIAAGTRPAAQRFTDVRAAPALTGWTERVFERPQAQGATQRVVVYTNRTASSTPYYRMGWWMNEPQAADGTHTTYRFIATSSLTAVDGRQAEITGTATYAGSAVGLYSLRPRTGDAMRGGSFTATTRLTADFGADTIEGAITHFRDEQGAAIPGWVVNLNSTSLTNRFNQGNTSGVGAGGLGWTGTFIQVLANQTGVNDRPPHHAYGTFHARVGRRVPDTGPYSSVRGTFAAKKTE